MTKLAQALAPNAVLASGRPGEFGTALKPSAVGDANRWVWLSYDQLNTAFLSSLQGNHNVGVVLIESRAKAATLPYHQQKLGVVLSNQRHFALELQDAGIPVLYVMSSQTYPDVLKTVTDVLGPLDAFEHAERSLRTSVQPLVDSGLLSVHPHPVG